MTCVGERPAWSQELEGRFCPPSSSCSLTASPRPRPAEALDTGGWGGACANESSVTGEPETRRENPPHHWPSPPVPARARGGKPRSSAGTAVGVSGNPLAASPRLPRLSDDHAPAGRPSPGVARAGGPSVFTVSEVKSSRLQELGSSWEMNCFSLSRYCA